MPLDSTPGGASANSFTSVAYADAYHADQLYSEDWAAANSTLKAKALITATRLIVTAINRVGWRGWITNPSQRLPVPRSGLFTIDGYAITSTDIPTGLQDATAEYAFRLIQLGQLPDTALDTAGIHKLVAGPVEIEYEQGASDVDTALPDAVLALLQPFIASDFSSTTVPLIRT